MNHSTLLPRSPYGATRSSEGASDKGIKTDKTLPPAWFFCATL